MFLSLVQASEILDASCKSIQASLVGFEESLMEYTPRPPIKKLAQRFAAILLIATLDACIGSRGEPFAPELQKNYVLTEDLVRTSLEVKPPGLFQSRRNAAFVMIPEEYLLTKEYIKPYPLPNLGEVVRGSRVRVEQMFTYSDFTASTRYGKFQFTKPRHRGAAHGLRQLEGHRTQIAGGEVRGYSSSSSVSCTRWSARVFTDVGKPRYADLVACFLTALTPDADRSQ